MDFWNQYQKEAVRLAKWFNRFKDKDYEEIYSVALVGMAEAIRGIEAGLCDHGNHRAYILSRMKGAIIDNMYRDHLIRVPKDEAKKIVESGDMSKFPMAYTTSNTFLNYEVLIDGESFEMSGDPLMLVGKEQHQPMDYADLLDNVLKLTPAEKELVELRLHGHTLHEIAEKHKVSHQTIKRKLDVIKGKVTQYIRKESLNVSTDKKSK